MKLNKFLAILLVISLLVIGYGYYEIHYGEVATGHKLIGVATLFIFLILMPVFIWHRYKDKDLSRFRLDQDENEEKDHKQ